MVGLADLPAGAWLAGLARAPSGQIISRLKQPSRSRLGYFLGVVAAIGLGLASRRFASALPEFVARYAGDTLWALMMFCIIGILAPKWSTLRVAVAALLVSYAVEVSQLSHAAWLDSLWHTRVGGLVLGYGFLWSDLVCYFVGVLLGATLELTARTFRASITHIPRP